MVGSLENWAVALQVIQLGISIVLFSLTFLWTRSLSGQSRFYLLCQFALTLSTIAATFGIIFIAHDDSALDLFRAAAVRPEVIIVQGAIAYKANKLYFGKEKEEGED